jgi:glycosyltransferase involved in cell wall biosynthesis
VYVAGEDRHPDGRSIEFSGCHKLGRLAPDRLSDWYARAAIYAMPARYEPFGLSILEAALSGCALVLGDIESLRELWHDAALFVPPGDADRLASALRTLIANPGLRAEIASLGSARARTFTPARMAREYMDAYTSLIAKRRLACAS